MTTRLLVLLGAASFAVAVPHPHPRPQQRGGAATAAHWRHARAGSDISGNYPAIIVPPPPAKSTGVFAPPPIVSASSSATLPNPSSSSPPCGLVEESYNPNQLDWVNSGTDAYLSAWVQEHAATIATHNGTGGFASAFFEYAVGKPDVTCAIDGSSDCDFDPCANPVLNTLQPAPGSTQNAFYVLQSVKNLRAYFEGVEQAFSMAALLGALSTDSWTDTFYKKPDGHDADDTETHGIVALKEIFNTLAIVVGVVAAFIAPEVIPAFAALEMAQKGVIIAARGTTAALVGGGMSGANQALKQSQYNGGNFRHAADVGTAIGHVVQESFTNIVSTNNVLMQGGHDSNGSTIATYLQGGRFLNASVNEVDAMSGFNSMLTGMAINALWKENKVFILGGGACGDNQGIGTGPANASWCDPATNTAWYLYWWKANDVISITAHRWGWVAPPPGVEQLGNGTYANITVANVIESSVKAYTHSGYNYTADVAGQRMLEAVTSGQPNPMGQGAAWEGIFTIPVCNVSQVVGSDVPNKQSILMQYGHDNRPQWCGPICDLDLNQTKRFINASNMENFKSPRHYCKKDPGYATLS